MRVDDEVATLTTGRAVRARASRTGTGRLELPRRRAGAHQQRPEGHGTADDRRRRALRARTARARRRRHRLRPRRAVRPAGQERPGRRHLERRRRHEQRAGLQERPVLPHQRRLRRLRRPPRARCPSRSARSWSPGCSSASRGSRCATSSSTARRPRRSCASTPPSPAGPPLPPAWSFGLWLSTSFTTSYDEETVTVVHRRHGRARTSRCRSSTSTASGCASSTGATSSGTRGCSPTRAGMLRRLKDRGPAHLRVDQPLHRPALPAVRGGQGRRLPAAPTGRRRVAVGPVAARHGAGRLHQPRRPASGTPAKLDALLDMGVDCFKTDFGERIPTDVVWYDGSDPERMHNYYTYLYNRTVFDAAAPSAAATGEAVVFARSATAGSPAVPGPLGRRLRVDVRSRWPRPARRAVAGHVRLRVLEPRHRRLRGHARPGALQAVDRLRPALLAQPAARQLVVPGAVAVRRGGRRRHCGSSPGSRPG